MMTNLVKRIISAVILAPLVIYITYKGGTPFSGMILLLFLVTMWEWIKLTTKFEHRILWFLIGILYIGNACIMMLVFETRRIDFRGIENFPLQLFILVSLVWIFDIFSYIFGKGIGGPKLIPKISPNKTWAGTLGGVTACVGFFFILSYGGNFGAHGVPDNIFYLTMVIHITVPIFALIGDLFESYIKRRAGVKDSGNIIPGHGGLLDRVDGLLMVMNVIGISSLLYYLYMV